MIYSNQAEIKPIPMWLEFVCSGDDGLFLHQETEGNTNWWMEQSRLSHSRKQATLEDVYSKTRKDFWQILKVFSQLVPAIMIEVRHQNTCDCLDHNDLTKWHTGRLGPYEVPQASRCQLDLSLSASMQLSKLTAKTVCGWWLIEHTVGKKTDVCALICELRPHNGIQKEKYTQQT